MCHFLQCKSKSVSTRGVDPYTSECVGPDSFGVHDTYNQVCVQCVCNAQKNQSTTWGRI